MKNLRQLKDLIKNISKKTDINAQILVRNYVLERLLERISLSELKDNFILKGGMLIAALVGIDMRSTVDMDATIKSYPVTKDSVLKAFDSILSVPVNDGVNIVLVGIESIRDEADYDGFRVSLEAQMDKARISIKADITTGDNILRLNIPGLLRRGLRSTNTIESAFSVVAKGIRNVKNWKNGTMVRRWVCVALLDAENRTNRIAGYRSMGVLISEIQRLTNVDEEDQVANERKTA